VPRTVRQYWWALQGRTRLNLNWDAINHDSVVLVTASEYALNEPDPASSARFVGAATITVDNISPHGPPYDPNHGVTFVVTVDWGTPLHVVTDITVLDHRPEQTLYQPLPWDRLQFQMQPQQQSNWCWAAVATSVSHYYDAASSWNQCDVANGQLSRTDCCGPGAAGPCNVYGYLDDALTRIGHFDHSTGSVTHFPSVRGEIDGSRPLCLRVAWSGGGAHFLSIIGYLGDATGYLALDDPIYGKSDISYDTLKASYQGSGSWTHSFYTKA